MLHWSLLRRIDLSWSAMLGNDLYWATFWINPEILSLLIGLGDWSSMSWFNMAFKTGDMNDIGWLHKKWHLIDWSNIHVLVCTYDWSIKCHFCKAIELGPYAISRQELYAHNIHVQENFANLAIFAKIFCTRIFPFIQYSQCQWQYGQDNDIDNWLICRISHQFHFVENWIILIWSFLCLMCILQIEFYKKHAKSIQDFTV